MPGSAGPQGPRGCERDPGPRDASSLKGSPPRRWLLCSPCGSRRCPALSVDTHQGGTPRRSPPHRAHLPQLTLSHKKRLHTKEAQLAKRRQVRWLVITSPEMALNLSVPRTPLPKWARTFDKSRFQSIKPTSLLSKFQLRSNLERLRPTRHGRGSPRGPLAMQSLARVAKPLSQPGLRLNEFIICFPNRI